MRPAGFELGFDHWAVQLVANRYKGSDIADHFPMGLQVEYESCLSRYPKRLTGTPFLE